MINLPGNAWWISSAQRETSVSNMIKLETQVGVSWASVKIKPQLKEPCCFHLVWRLWETITQSWPLIKHMDGRLSLVLKKQTSPLCLITLPLLLRMVIWYWLGFMRAHRSSSLLFHRTEWRSVLSWVSWPCACCIICCYGFAATCALNVRWGSWLRHHIVHFVIKQLFPAALRTETKHIHLYVDASAFLLFLSLSRLLFLGEQMFSGIVCN